jgi:glycosyltransferase involved in cell wall biosynthesis
MKNLCFFVKTNDVDIFSRIDFYKNDIEILTQLGFNVHLTNNIFSLFKQRYDVYYVWWYGFGVFPAILSFISCKPCIIVGNIHTVTGGGLSDWPFFKKITMQISMKLASYSLFTSYTEFNRLGNFKPRRSEVLFNCVDDNLYSTDANVQKEKIILMISNLTVENVKRKMILETINATKLFLLQNSDFKLIICGKWGDGLSSVKDLISKLGLKNNVILKGSVTLGEKISLLQKAKLYLQPTKAEGFGVAILEAQSCGTPVITSFEPCINEIFSDSVVRVNNLNDLNEALNELVFNSKFYNQYLNNGLINSKKYTKTIRAKKLQIITESVIKI